MLDPFAVMDVGDAVIVDCAMLAAPTVNVTIASSVIEEPFNVPVIVPEPTDVGDVNTAVYVPFALSVTLPSVPAVVFRTTVPPLEVRLLLFASFNWTVIVDVLDPLAVIETGEAVISDVATLAAPTVNVTTASSVIALPFNVPVTVADPT